MAVAVIAAMLLVFFGPIVTMRGFVIQDDIGASDMTNSAFPARAHLSHSLKEGRFPLWMPEVYSGYPFLADCVNGACFPPNLLLYGLLPLLPAHNLSILLPLVVAGLGIFAYARKCGSGQMGALLAMLAFSHGGFFVCHIKHPHMLDAACLLPWILLCGEHAIDRKACRWLLADAVLFALAVLAGHPQIAYYLYLIAAVHFVAYLGQPWDWTPRAWISRVRGLCGNRLAYGFAGAVLLSVGLTAIQWLPTYELHRLARRASGVDFAFAARQGYHPLDALMFLMPHARGDAGTMNYQGTIFWENYAYVGLWAFVVGLYGFVAVFRRCWHGRFFAAAGLVAFLLVLGPWTPLFRVCFEALPGFNAFRFPARLLLVVAFALSLSAALGWTQLLRFISGRYVWGAKLGAALSVLLLLGSAFDLLHNNRRHVPMVPASEWFSPVATAAALGAQSQEGRLFTLASTFTHRAAYQQAGGWQGNLSPYLVQREFLQPNLNVTYGLSSADGYVNLVPDYVTAVWGAAGHEEGLITPSYGLTAGGQFVLTARFTRLARLFNLRYLLSPLPIKHPRLERISVRSPAWLYHYPDMLGRCWVVPDFVVAEDREAAETRILDPDFEPSKTVVLSDAIDRPGDAGLGGTARIIEASPHAVAIEAEANGPGFLVLSDTYYPGWRATVDGAEQPILQANVCQRAVALPPGKHEVRFEYRPRSVFLGGLATLVASLTVLVLALWPRRGIALKE